MEFFLVRDYHLQGVNGKLYQAGELVCETIELPWRQNATGISCIPEGQYDLELRTSEKYGEHIWVKDVPGRSMILMHPANYALKELRGCIAPVMRTTGPGVGIFSKKALGKILSLMGVQEEVYLIIRS